jgi:cellulose synthase/poly-beta-1,6-N-acetylglucosamine synthase-like glycosyltransferase
MTGARAIPLDNDDTFLGYATQIIWRMVSLLSYTNPKLGEAIAFKKLKAIEPQTAVDEAYIESAIVKQGLKLKYTPDAIIYNHGATNLRDFINQRVRIHTGHLVLRKQTGYSVSTMRVIPKFRLTVNYYSLQIKHLIWFPCYVMLEFICICIGYYKYYVKQDNPVIWTIIKSSKTLEVK